MHFDQESYFPPNFKYLGYVGLVAGSVFILIGNVVVGLPFLLVALGLSFTRMGCSIDIQKKTLTNYVNVLGLKFGSPVGYQELRKLLVRPNEVSQVLNSRGSSTTLRYTIYNTYLFYDNDSVLLQGDKTEERVVSKMKAVAADLSIPFEVGS